MLWEKKGLIFCPKGNFGWMNSHAQVPTLLLKKKVLRVYFATRPKNNLSLTTYCDLDVKDLSKIVYIHDKPILNLGEPGTFDEFGIMPSSIVVYDGLVYLYYSGWSRGVTIPYNNYTGLAISEDGGKTFRKYSKGPVVDRTPEEIYSATSPYVMHEKGKWHMWYTSGTNWLFINNKYEHTYDLKYASSEDGILWNRNYEVAVAQKNKYEAITRPAIVKIGNIFYMWYCYRGSRSFRSGKDSYRIGLSSSSNLKNWRRIDSKSGIKKSKIGWDSKMIAYPSVVKIGGSIIMIYNGNDFGKEGFGYAILRKIYNKIKI